MNARAAAAGIAIGAAVMAGCGEVRQSRCAPPSRPPVALSDAHRRAPVVAGNAGSTIVAAWETLTGAPIEARVLTGRGTDRTWGPVARISERDARSPALAVASDGTTTLAWQGYAGTVPTIRLARNVDGRWQAPIDLSDPARGARSPQVGVDAAGNVTVAWLRDVGARDSEVQVTTLAPEGTPGATSTIAASRGRLLHLRLAVAGDGGAALVWATDRPSRAVYATARSGETWPEPTRLTAGGGTPLEPTVAVAPSGRAAAIWAMQTPDGAEIRTASFDDARWSPSMLLDRGDERAREMSRPGRADTSPRIALLEEGAAAAWTLTVDGRARVRAATRGGADAWQIADLSSPASPAGGVDLSVLAGATPTVGWEEIDAGLLRVRVGAIGGGRCHDVALPVGESAAIRFGGGPGATTAVYLDLNRGRVMAADLG